eukprot:571640-Hanusia_phi.AAC.4
MKGSDIPGQGGTFTYFRRVGCKARWASCEPARERRSGAMYNGVGLSTVRGSATNGYVQRNLAHVQGKTRVDYQKELEKGMAKPSLASKEPSWEILEHQRKRQTEVKIMEFRIALEDKGVSEEVIEERVAEVRRKLESEVSCMNSPPMCPRHMIPCRDLTTPIAEHARELGLWPEEADRLARIGSSQGQGSSAVCVGLWDSQGPHGGRSV